MHVQDAEAYCATLRRNGLVGLSEGEWIDFAMHHQVLGLKFPAPWLRIETVKITEGTIVAGWSADAPPGKVVVPEGWRFAGSVSDHKTYVTRDTLESLPAPVTVGDLEVRNNAATGAPMYTARSLPEEDREPAVRQFCDHANTACNALAAEIDALPKHERKEALSARRAMLEATYLARLQTLTTGAGASMPETHLALGTLLRALNRREEAVMAFEGAFRLTDSWHDLYMATVNCMLELGWYEGALRYAKASVDRFPDRDDVWANLAAAYSGTGDPENAKLAIARALELGPDDPITASIRDWIEREARKQAPWWRRWSS